jgi:hypothetical protein
MLDFERLDIHFNLNLILAFEILWHSPRVPADAASAILEVICYQYFSFLIHNFKRSG